MHGPVVLITGCSSGIGRDLALRLSAAGYRVVATARRPETLADIPAAQRLALDVADPASAEAAVAAAVAAHGRIDVLVNNAGYGQLGALPDLSDEQVRAMFEVNVFGLLRMVRAVVPHMRRQGGGRIINVGSLAGRVALPVMGAYCATKSAVAALSDALRLELRPFGIHVVLIEPGAIRTRFAETARAHLAGVEADPAFRPLYAAFLRLQERLNAAAPGPEAVSRVIQRAIEAPRPRARYQAPAHMAMGTGLVPLIPTGLMDRLVAWALGWPQGRRRP